MENLDERMRIRSKKREGGYNGHILPALAAV